MPIDAFAGYFHSPNKDFKVTNRPRNLLGAVELAEGCSCFEKTHSGLPTRSPERTHGCNNMNNCEIYFDGLCCGQYLVLGGPSLDYSGATIEKVYLKITTEKVYAHEHESNKRE